MTPAPNDPFDGCANDPTEDDLVDVILDELVEAAFSPDRSQWTDLTQAIAATLEWHPQRSGVVAALASELELLLDEASEEADAPPGAPQALADLAGRLADTIGSPDFAAVYIARFPLVDDAQRRADAHRVWRLLPDVDPRDQLDYAMSAAAMALEVDDGELGFKASAFGLEHADSCDPAHIDARKFLHEMAARAVALTCPADAASYIDQVLLVEPDVACDELREQWCRSTCAEMIRRVEQEAPAAEFLPLADGLAGREPWWPPEDEFPCAVSLMLTKAYASGLVVDDASRWLERSDRYSTSDPTLIGERACLRGEVAYLRGESGRLARTLLENAVDAKGSPLGEHRLRWLQLARMTAELMGDDPTADRIQRAMVDVQATTSDEDLAAMGLGGRDVMRLVSDLSDRALVVQRRAARLGSTLADLDELDAILAALPTGHDQFRIGLLNLLSMVALMHFRFDLAESARSESAALLAELKARPTGGMPAETMGHFHDYIRVTSAMAQGRIEPAHVVELERLRSATAAQGNDILAATMASVLALVYRKLGDHTSALDAGIAGLALEVRRSETINDAGERLALHKRREQLIAICLSEAVAAGRPAAVAELLEIIRAQPIPLARVQIPLNELSFAALASELVPMAGPLGATQGATSPLLPWGNRADGQVAGGDGAASNLVRPPESGTPLFQRGAVEGAAHPGVVLLGGLPSIRMPWGVAFDDQLRSAHCAVRVAVRVIRGPVDP